MIMNTFDLSQVYFPRKILVELRFFYLLLFNFHIPLNNKENVPKKKKKKRPLSLIPGAKEGIFLDKKKKKKKRGLRCK